MDDRFSVSYGSGRDHVADVALPPGGNGKAPFVILLHGGFWRAQYDRQYLVKMTDALVADGYAVANVEYRRTGDGGGWPETFDDVASALDQLTDLIEERSPGRVDYDNAAYVGHSAGGQLGLWAAHRPGARVAGVVALAPVADLAESHRLVLGEAAVADLLGGGPDEVPDRYAAVDPVALGAPKVPVVVVHGAEDEMVPAEISRRYQATAGCALVVVPEATHVDVVKPGSVAWPAVRDAIRQVLG
ncbi:alpha/beta hydrolase family protein [Actinocrispum wychmicini]|uniref:Prolyl oligopeptidase family protein n=1 Tax=Actinocrispum wychmicini TaxID=1213861 RepID=A0A4R2JZ90_9PSEU|nr:alpha/beta hydrolase [Actinocrispum wychmicini]TCO62746.1 prolyl oligopeptidase family protein [Actinocrispum wychmicini]